MLTLIQVLRALGGLEEKIFVAEYQIKLNAFLPEPGPSPLQLAKMKGRERQRASRQSSSEGED